MDEALAENIKQSAIWHKKYCKDTECNVSLILLGMTYAKLLGRKEPTEEELKNYFH